VRDCLWQCFVNLSLRCFVNLSPGCWNWQIPKLIMTQIILFRLSLREKPNKAFLSFEKLSFRSTFWNEILIYKNYPALG
jgi:hypothetical protein